MSILQGIWNMSDNLDSLQIVKKYSNGLRTLNHVNFRALVHSFNPSISDAEIDTFFKQTTAEYQQPLITTYILHQLIRKQSFAASTKRSPLELKDKLTKLLKGKNLQIQKVLAVFDQERKGKLTESEFQQFIEYYIPNIGPIEYEELRKSLRSQIIDDQSVSSWLESNTSSDQRPSNPVTNKLTQAIKQQTPQPQPQQIKPEPVKQPVQETAHEKEIEQKVVSKWDKLKSHDPQDVHPHLKEIVDMVAHNVDFAEIVKLDHPLDGIKEFIQTFHQLDTQNKLHEDKDFPPNQQSLGPKCQGYQWQRLSELWGEKHHIFERDTKHEGQGLGEFIGAEDIQQGALGDCYFLSALSVIAMKWPQVILDAFLTQKPNHCGMYAVKYFVDGIEHAIVMDDFIPVKNNKPAFTQSNMNESWVIILEKAWAKVFGSYSNIIAGRSIEVMQSFLGGPTWTIKTDDKDFKKKLQDAVDKDCAMTVGTFAKNSGKNFEEMGLVPGHAYACLGVRFVKHSQKGEVELIKLRNPWGKTEWKGDWSDNSALWQPGMRDEEKADDGIFHMQYEHFIMYYQSVDCAYFKPNYKYEAIQAKSQKNKSSYFRFEITEDSEYYVSVHQLSERHFRDKVQNYKYAQLRIVLAQELPGGQYKFIDAKTASYYEASVGGLLKRGNYVVAVKTNWIYKNEDEYKLSIYGPQRIQAKQVDKIPKLLQLSLSDLARANTNVTPFKESDKITKCSDISMEHGLGYFFISNKTADKTLEMTVTFTNMEGLKLRKPNRGNQYKVTVGPNQDQAVIVTVSADGFGLGQKMSYLIK